MQRKLPKISITLSPELLDDIAYVVERTGVSRSALISELLGETVPHIRHVLEQVPVNPTPADVVRFRGASADIVRERLDSIRQLDEDLFSQIMGEEGGKDA